MASTTVLTAPAPAPAPSSDNIASASAVLTSAGSAPLAVSSSFDSSNKGFHSSMQPPQMQSQHSQQSQQSSQQSFSMSQPSSQQNAANTSMYRQYSEPTRHAPENAQVMPIYSVYFFPFRLPFLPLTDHLGINTAL